LILSDDSEFWQSYANYCIVIKAAVAALKEFDGKQPCMGNVYIIMRVLRHQSFYAATAIDIAKLYSIFLYL
jgi:hypothetical protein